MPTRACGAPGLVQAPRTRQPSGRVQGPNGEVVTAWAGDARRVTVGVEEPVELDVAGHVVRVVRRGLLGARAVDVVGPGRVPRRALRHVVGLGLVRADDAVRRGSG